MRREGSAQGKRFSERTVAHELARQFADPAGFLQA